MWIVEYLPNFKSQFWLVHLTITSRLPHYNILSFTLYSPTQHNLISKFRWSLLWLCICQTIPILPYCQLTWRPGNEVSDVHFLPLRLLCRYDNSWTSVGEILAGENQAKVYITTLGFCGVCVYQTRGIVLPANVQHPLCIYIYIHDLCTCAFENDVF